jgi:hypothetical protein
VRLAPVLLLAAACTASPAPQPETAPAAPPSTTTAAPRSFADLTRDGRREVCARIVEQVRLACDPDLRHLDAGLIEQCTGDHPIWACPQVRVTDHARCIEDRDAAACTAHQKQTEACAVTEALRDCRIVVASVDPGGPAELAGLKPGDIVMNVDGAFKSVQDIEGILALVKRSGGRAIRVDAVAPGNPLRELSITPTGAPLRFGASLAPTPNCSGYTPRFSGVPCNARAVHNPVGE